MKRNLGHYKTAVIELFQFAGGVCLEAHEIKFGVFGNGQECRHEARINRRHEQMFWRPNTIVALELRRRVDLQARQHGRAQLSVTFACPFNFSVVKIPVFDDFSLLDQPVTTGDLRVEDSSD